MTSEAPDKQTELDENSEPRFGKDDYKPDFNKSLSDDELAQKESSDNSSSPDDNSTEKESLFSGDENSGFLNKFRGKFTKKRVATIAIAGTLSVGGFAGFAILQGPFQFIHFAQTLQKHFNSNEDFGNNRTSKILIYSLLGKGTQNGRLGVTGNYSANKWEKKLLDETGMRPAYSDPGRRFVGFEIVNEDKAFRFLDGADSNLNQRQQKKLEGLMGSNAEIVKGNTVRNGAGTRLNVVNAEGNTINANTNVLSLAKQGFDDRRAWIRTMGKAMSTHNVVGSMGSRLLIKRAGVNFHPLNKLKGKSDDAIAKFLDNRTKNIQDGTLPINDLAAGSTTNPDDNTTSQDPADVQAAEESKSYIEDFKNSGAFKSTANAAVIIGVLCAAKSFGDNIPEYKYQNNVLPMIRIGMGSVASGNQVMSGDDFDLEVLGEARKFMYDDTKKSSAFQAESILAEQGKTGGKPIPPEADLKNVNDKPKFFDVLGGIPFLGTTCSVQEGFFGLPIIKQVSGAISSVVGGLTNAALSLGGTSTDELLESALKTASGRSVDPNAKGADFGNFANVGTFLAANDAAIGMGGAPLNALQSAGLKEVDRQNTQYDKDALSTFKRYFDITNSDTLASSVLNSTANMIHKKNPFGFIPKIFGSLSSYTSPRLKAATTGYDYGVEKYGFSLEEQRDPRFEDPYENALIVEPQLEQLNAQYGKCFGIEVNADDTGVHLNNGKTVNVFDPDIVNSCKKTNDEMYLRYRFYLADSVTAVSLACYTGDPADPITQKACSEIGAGGTTTTQTTSGGASQDTIATGSNDARQLAALILANPNVSYPYTDTKGVSARDVLQEVAKTGLGIVNSGDTSVTRVAVNPKMLQAILEYAQTNKIGVNPITNADHSTTSNHYKGLAVDFNCTPALNRQLFDQIAAKYGGRNNGEVCPDNAHWHYDFLL